MDANPEAITVPPEIQAQLITAAALLARGEDVPEMPAEVAAELDARAARGGVIAEPTAENGDAWWATNWLQAEVGRIVARDYLAATGADAGAVAIAFTQSGLLSAPIGEDGTPDALLPAELVPWGSSELAPLVALFQWLATEKGRPWRDRWGANVVGAMLTEAFERERAALAEERAANAELRRQVAAVPLGDRTVYPPAVLSLLRNPAVDARNKLGRIEQGSLFADTATLEALHHAERSVSTRQLYSLTSPEWRALHGTFRILSSFGDDGRAFARSSAEVPWPVYCKAAGVNPRQPKSARALLTASRQLGARTVHATVTMPDRNDPTKRLVMAGSVHVASITPTWRVSPTEAKRITDAWNDLAEGEEWHGPLPATVQVDVPDMMRAVAGALVLDGSVPEKLDAGSRTVRGRNKGAQPIDHALLLTLTQRTQHHVVANIEGHPPTLWAYLERDAFLREYHGDRYAKAVQQRNLDKLEEAYLQSCEALRAGGFVLVYELKHRGRLGALRDRFALSPTAVRGLQARALPTPADPDQLDALSQPRRKRGRPRKAK